MVSFIVRGGERKSDRKSNYLDVPGRQQRMVSVGKLCVIFASEF
jgi:hypothetical protein